MLHGRKNTLAPNLSFDLTNVHSSWRPCLERGLAAMDPNYLNILEQSDDWLPGPKHIFNAFSLPLDQVNTVLFGESPYPRRESAIGYAFWDGAVKELWSETGLNKKVNRATSLRNIIKMLLVAEGLIPENALRQADIAAIDKSRLIQTNEELFANLLHHGFLLLNTCLVLRDGSKHKDAQAWRPFLQELLFWLLDHKPDVTFLFLGNIAFTIEKLLKNRSVRKILAEHPYNHTFITNQTVLTFFAPFHLLKIAQK